MINIFRADLYRIFRGKGIYITFLALLGYIGMIIAANMAGDIILPFVDAAADVQLNGANSTYLLFANTMLLPFFIMPLFFVVTAPIFHEGTAKNEVSWGISRVRLYISRLILVAVLCMMLYVFYIGAGMLAATLVGGFGYMSEGFWINLLLVMGAHLFMLIAASWFGVFLVFSFKVFYAIEFAYMGVLMGPLLVSAIFMGANVDAGFLLNFDFMTNFMALGFLREMNVYETLASLAIGAALLVVSTAAGLVKFIKAEIK